MIKYKTAHGLILGLNQIFIKQAKENPNKTYTSQELSVLFSEKVVELNKLAKQEEVKLEEWDKKLPLLNKSQLESNKTDILNQLDKGMICPCCDQYVKRYKRKLNSGMAFCLINIYKMIPDLNFNNGWFHINDILQKRRINPTNLEFQKLRFWGFVEPKTFNKEDESKAGYWRLTEKGKNFVENKLIVPKHIFLYNREFLGFSNETTTIKEALRNKFDYEELMKE